MADNLIKKIEGYFNFIESISGKFIYFDEKLPEAVEIPYVAPAVTPNNPTQNPVITTNVKPSISPAFTPKQEVKSPEPVQIIQSGTNREYIGGKVDKDWDKSTNLEELYGKIHNCLQCSLGPTRNKFVFGSGSPTADIMIIGEAPGADEDAQGLPFVGRAGQLLTKIIEAINLTRDEVFIANIIKCRPPANRRPTPIEVDACEPYLKKQIDIIKPKFILALGLTAVDTLFKSNHKMGEIRGKILNYNGIDTLVTYHPAALLRNPGWKKLAWEDVKLLRKLYDEYLEQNK